MVESTLTTFDDTNPTAADQLPSFGAQPPAIAQNVDIVV